MDQAAMKSVGLFFILTFGFFFLGQMFWTYGIFADAPLLGSRELDQGGALAQWQVLWDPPQLPLHDSSGDRAQAWREGEDAAEALQPMG